MTLQLGKEPNGLLLQRADVFEWVPGLTKGMWKKLRPHLCQVKIPGSTKPFYRKSEIETKLVTPIREGKLS